MDLGSRTGHRSVMFHHMLLAWIARSECTHSKCITFICWQRITFNVLLPCRDTLCKRPLGSWIHLHLPGFAMSSTRSAPLGSRSVVYGLGHAWDKSVSLYFNHCCLVFKGKVVSYLCLDALKNGGGSYGKMWALLARFNYSTHEIFFFLTPCSLLQKSTYK